MSTVDNNDSNCSFNSNNNNLMKSNFNSLISKILSNDIKMNTVNNINIDTLRENEKKFDMSVNMAGINVGNGSTSSAYNKFKGNAPSKSYYKIK